MGLCARVNVNVRIASEQSGWFITRAWSNALNEAGNEGLLMPTRRVAKMLFKAV